MNLLKSHRITHWERSTDYGKHFGWWLVSDGEKIASLDYRAHNIDSQFWDVYFLTPLTSRFSEIGLEQNEWGDADVYLQNRFALSYMSKDFFISPLDGDLVNVRFVAVPGEALIQASEQYYDTVGAITRRVFPTDDAASEELA
ncbi:MAG: hypothetical protein P1V20_20820 [Verrucomicrobiales bacterium]|nr:hypothetical protein [Verrucomicrobiales bacterium]